MNRCTAPFSSFLLLSLFFVIAATTTRAQSPLSYSNDLKALITNNSTLWNRAGRYMACANAQVKWERTVVRPSEGSHRAVSTKISVSDPSLLSSIIVADSVSSRAFVDINQMKLAGVDIEIFTTDGKREFDIEAPSWSSAAVSGVVFTALRTPVSYNQQYQRSSTEIELLLNVHIRYQNFTAAGGMCEEFTALDTPRLFLTCTENEGEKIVREVPPVSEPEKLVVSVPIGATDVSHVVALTTFVFTTIGALLIIVASLA